VNAAKRDLFTTTTRTTDEQQPKTAALNIATAQRLVLADLQHDIAKCAEAVLGNLAGPRDIRRLGSSVKEYCKSSNLRPSSQSVFDRRATGEALRNFGYMQEYQARHREDDEYDPFYLKSTKILQRQAMEEAGLIPNHMQPKGRLPGTLDRARFAELPECHEVWPTKRQMQIEIWFAS
jgi:hypothetical protein